MTARETIQVLISRANKRRRFFFKRAREEREKSVTGRISSKTRFYECLAMQEVGEAEGLLLAGGLVAKEEDGRWHENFKREWEKGVRNDD